jgi:hypothetical protein
MRENFESAWFLGGDIRSAAAILDMSVKELEEYLRESSIELGKGVSIFRNNNVAYDARLMRGGMASNDFVYWLLGKADGFTLPDDLLPVAEPNIEAGRYGRRSSGLVVPADYEERDTQRITQPLETGSNSTSVGVPNSDLNGLVEGIPSHPVESRPSEFQPVGEDKIIPADMHEDLIYWYGKLGNVQKARTKIGLSNSRYQHHASFILEQHGYKSS